MKKIVFATNNFNKLNELKRIIGDRMEVLSLNDINVHEDIPETGVTLAENASQKSHFIYDKFHLDCFSDDTGLEVEALNGAPGVYSARYAGNNATYNDNVNKLLHELEGKSNRKATFKTVISLILDGKEYQFEGRVDGVITRDKRGTGGFGYDPVFLPDDYTQTFAEMSPELKNTISHRGRATAKLVAFLKTLA
jgi:XTP/dITP diphosphohydrolase